MGLAHHGGEHIEAPAMGHAKHDFGDAKGAAAFDDLFKRGNHCLPAVETKALGAAKAQVAEFFEAFSFNKLAQDRALAFARKANFLVRAFHAFLNPGFFSWIGNMHELNADRAAIGAAQDRQHFRDRRRFQTQNVIDKNLAAVIGLSEPVAGRMQLFMVFCGLHAEWIELGVEMAAHPVGANHHQRAHAVAGRQVDLGLGLNRALLAHFGADLLADGLLDLRPITIER